jgi:nucleoside-diphosphate-sugar epimerase
MEKPVLIIGGNGFLGRRLVQSLLKDEGAARNIVTMDMNPPKESFAKSIERYGSRFTYVRGDITQIEEIMSLIKQYGVEKIINLAYLMVFETQQAPRLGAKINVLGMANAFEAARLTGVDRVIYASSHAVYGHQDYYGDRDITEDDFRVPKLIYGVMKDLNERTADVYSDQYGLKTLCFRPCHVFGAGREAAKVGRLFNDLISDPALGKSFQTEFAPWPYLWTYVDDVTRFITVLLDAPSPKYKVYNIGGWLATPADVAEIIKQYLPDAKITFGKENADLGSPRRVSNARAREDLGFNLMPLKDSVLLHINEARAAAGLKPIHA